MLREPIRWDLNSNPVQPTVSQNQKKLKPTESKTKVAWGCVPMPHHHQPSTTNKDQSSMGVSPCYCNSKQLKSKQNKTKWMGCKVNVKQDGGHGCEGELKEHGWMWNRMRNNKWTNRLTAPKPLNQQPSEPTASWTDKQTEEQTGLGGQVSVQINISIFLNRYILYFHIFHLVFENITFPKCHFPKCSVRSQPHTHPSFKKKLTVPFVAWHLTC